MDDAAQFGIRGDLRQAKADFRPMKRSLFSILIAVSALLTGCGSLENPFANFFRTGRDARVYNAQTGQFEWPEEKKPSSERKAAKVAGALASTPAPVGRSDTRYFDAQKNQWVEQQPEDAPATKRPKTGPRPPGLLGTPAPLPTPGPTPVSAQATGYYNTSTGKIEWGAGAPAAHAPMPAPAPAKHWWWPF
jgi:hypothetical protein